MNRNDGARGDARKRDVSMSLSNGQARESARQEAGAGDVEALAEALWIADRDASASGTGFGATFAEDSCNYAYRSQARYTLASDWLARVIADAKAEALREAADWLDTHDDWSYADYYAAVLRDRAMRGEA